MKSKLTKLSTPALAILLNILGTIPASAVDDVCNTGASDEVKEAAGCPGYGTGDDLPNVVINILNAVIGVAALVSVIWIVIGGASYITSSGDPNKVKKARETIIFACIGLVVCVLAFAIVNFVISRFIKNELPASSYTSKSACEKAGFTWKNSKCQ